jgi:uncharacterized protein YciI
MRNPAARRTLRLLAALLGAAVPAARLHAQKAEAPRERVTYWWMFFVSGDNRTPLAKEEAERMQKAHIANMERLGKEGKALMGGPFGDRTRLRGIVVLTVKSREDVIAEFKDDPYVQAGRLEIEAYRWSTEKLALGKPEEPFKLQETQFVLLKKGPNWTDEATEQVNRDQEAHLKHIRAMQAAGDLALAGPLQDAGDLRGLLLFRTNDAEKVEKLLAEDPHIRSGRLVAERHPLYVGRGLVGDPPAAPKRD